MKNLKEIDLLYSSLVCALSHNITTCDDCKLCGEDSISVRLNLIKELSNYMNKELPWEE